MKILEAIGDRVEEAWSATGRDPEAFADIAARAIEEQDLRTNLDAGEVLRWVQTGPYPDQNGENQYGEPAITFVRKEGFRVELIFWMDGVANIHGHAGEGAFFLLEGERLHATYELESPHAASPGVLLGDVRLRDVELLQAGDLRKIYPGFRSIHSLFFIGRPCVTVSVRAVDDDAPFYLYAHEHTLLDKAVSRASINKRLSAFDFFVRLHPDQRIAMARKHLESASDIFMAETILLRVEPSVSEAAFCSLVDVARERFGDWIDKSLAAAAKSVRRRALEMLLPICDARGPRILVGLMWTGADRNMALAILARAFPGEDPLVLVDQWIVELRGPRTPVEELSAALGITAEDDVSAMLRELRQRIARRPPSTHTSCR